MSAWDHHLDESTASKNLTIDGKIYDLFNPFNFTDQPFVLSVSNPVHGKQSYAFGFVASCVFPTSGIYCPLNRWLYYTEIAIGLVTLMLSYQWLSVISIAAALNYTAVAAIHAIILLFVDQDGTKYFDSDSRALYEILGTCVFFAHPLQQWSQTLQKKNFARTRVIIACWTVLVCAAFIITDRGLRTQALVELAVIDNSTGLPLPSNLDLIEILSGDLFNDTINPWQTYLTAKQWNAAHAQLRPCPIPSSTFTSVLRRGQNLAADVYGGGLALNKAYSQLDAGFQVFAIFKSVATLGIAFYGQCSTIVVRAKLYLWIRGSGDQAATWRRVSGVAIATLYHSVQFVLGIMSMPVAMAFIILWELPLGEPRAEEFTDIGQWGPWAGAALLAVAIILNTTSTAYVLRSTLVWLLSRPAHALFPRHVERRQLPRLRSEATPLDRLIGFPRWLALFFIDEYLSTRDWLRDPYEASLTCLLEESSNAAAHKSFNQRTNIPTVSEAGV